MSILNSPKTFITIPGSSLPIETQTRLLEEKAALNDNPQAITIAKVKIKGGDSFVRMPCILLQRDITLQFTGRCFAFYMWMLGFANNLDKPKGKRDSVYFNLDQWLRAGFVVTVRLQKELKDKFGFSASTVSRYTKELEQAGYIKVVHNYSTARCDNVNVWILGYKVRDVTVWLAELSTCQK